MGGPGADLGDPKARRGEAAGLPGPAAANMSPVARICTFPAVGGWLARAGRAWRPRWRFGGAGGKARGRAKGGSSGEGVPQAQPSPEALGAGCFSLLGCSSAHPGLQCEVSPMQSPQGPPTLLPCTPKTLCTAQLRGRPGHSPPSRPLPQSVPCWALPDPRLLQGDPKTCCRRSRAPRGPPQSALSPREAAQATGSTIASCPVAVILLIGWSRGP